MHIKNMSLKLSLLFSGTPLGTAADAGGEHAGREAGANVDTRLQHVPGTRQRVPATATAAATWTKTAVATRLLSRGLVLFVVAACGHIFACILAVAVVGWFMGAIVVVVSVIPSTFATISSISTVPSISSTVSRISSAVSILSSVSSAVSTLSRVSTEAVVSTAISSASRLHGPVSGPSVGSRTRITAVLSLPWVPFTGRVRFPGTVLGTGGPNGRSDWALEGAEAAG